MGFFNRLANAIQRLPWLKPYWLWAVLLLTIPALGLLLSIVFWDWLSFDESRGTTIRNVGLIIAAVTALPLAIWRGLVAEKQAGAAQQSLRNERYQKGAEMLGSEALSVRMGGIYALQSLAKEHPKEYHVQIMRLICAFVRHPTKDVEHEKKMEADLSVPQIREDVQSAMNMISFRDQIELVIESEQNYSLDLDNARLSFVLLISGNLAGAQLRKADLSNAILVEANLADAWPMEANLKNAWLRKVNLHNAQLLLSNLSGAKLHDADLSGAVLSGAKLVNATLSNAQLKDSLLLEVDLSGADLSEVTGLKQAQLDQARADPDNPPKLEGAFDAETGKPLIWRGGQGAPLKAED